MTDRLDSLKALREKVRAGEASGFDVSRCFYEIAGLHAFRARGREAFDGSLDAAAALHDAVLLGRPCAITFGQEYGATATYAATWDHMHISESAKLPARAWLLAILSALITIEEGKA